MTGTSPSDSSTYTPSYEELQKLLEQTQKDLLAVKRRVTGYVDIETGTIIMHTDELKTAIHEKVKDIYDSIKVEQIEHLFAGAMEKVPTRKITLNRTWTLWDTAALIVPFWSVLLNSNSIYSRTINENAIADYILDVDSSSNKTTLLERVFTSSLANFKKSSQSDEKIRKIEKKRTSIEKHFLPEEGSSEKSSENIEKDEDLKTFIQIYKKQFDLYMNPKKDLEAAYWQSKTIFIYVPNACDRNADIELHTVGVVTPFTIKAGKFFKSLKKPRNSYKKID